MYLSGSQQIQRSMNGLLKIKATQIDAKVANIGIINNITEINGKDGEDIIFDTDVGKVIKFKDDVIMDASLNIAGNTVTKNITTVGNDDITGTIFIRYPSDPTLIYMRINYEPSLYGFCFTDESPGGRIMNFRVKNANGIGYKLFYFSSGQLYSEMPVYMNDWCNIASNRTLSFGDANPSLFVGAGIKFVPSAGSGIGDGWKFHCKGFGQNQNTGAYQTLFTHNDLTNTERMTLQMNWSDIRSKVKHTFEQDASFNTNISLNGNLIGNGNIHCNTFDVSNNSIFNGVSTYNANIFANGNLHCNTFDVSGNAIFKGTTTLEAITTKAISCTTLSATGLISTSGNLLASGTGSNLIFGTTTFNGNVTTSGLTCSSLTNNGVGTFANIINQTSSTATNNRITQTRVTGDVNGNANVFKYTQIRYTSSAPQQQPILQLIDDGASPARQLNFFTNLSGGSYNSIINTGDRAIMAVNSTGDACAFNLTTYGATVKHGVKVSHDTSLNCSTNIYEGNYNLRLNSLTGMAFTNAVANSATPDFNILNLGEARGLNFICNTDTGGNSINPLIDASNAVITTQTANNSILTISPRGSITNGLKLTNTSATTASFDLRSGTGRILLNHNASTSSIDCSANTFSVSCPNSVLISSPDNTFTTTNAGNQKYRADTHTFSLANGTQGGTLVYLGGNLIFNRSDTSFNQINTADNLMIASTGSNYLISGSVSGSNQYYQADTHNFVDRTNNTGLNCNVSIRGNITLSGTSKINFSDGTSIGTIVSSTLNATATLTSNTIFNCGSISLSAGTWSVSVNCCVAVITGVTTVGEMLAGYSTSSTALSQSTNLSIINAGSYNYNIGNQWCLSSANTIVVSSTTTYYMITRCLFGSIGRFQYVNSNSAFQATKIA